MTDGVHVCGHDEKHSGSGSWSTKEEHRSEETSTIEGTEHETSVTVGSGHSEKHSGVVGLIVGGGAAVTKVSVWDSKLGG